MEELQNLQILLDELLASIQQVLASGEELSDEFQALLAQELADTFNRITELEAQNAQQTQQPNPTDLTAQNRPEPSSDARLLWLLSGQDEQTFISYLHTFPSPETHRLLANPDLLSLTMSQLMQAMPPGQLQEIDGIEQSHLQSSNIWGSSYNPRNRKMRVRFQGGAEYEYDGVPPNIYRAFNNGSAAARTKGQNRYGRWWPSKFPSAGAAMNQFIKAGGYNYRRIR